MSGWRAVDREEVNMARTDNDSWEITESVGATALGVAASRARETESDNPLIRDPFARLFLDATGAGIRQAVILAAGLDARSWRLPWPDGTTVYELDQPRVLEFKLSTLQEHGAQPTCNRVAVPVDLRQEWPAALQQAGFDASAPSAWSAEGLMPYLPAAAQELLFDRVQRLTVTASRVGVEALAPNFMDPELRARRREWMDRVRAVMAKVDPTREVPRTDELWYFEEREDVGDWFRRHGWQVTVTPSVELMAGYGRKPPKEFEEGVPQNLFVSAQQVAAKT
jgi:methyltransferase (TIGR00027 family)